MVQDSCVRILFQCDQLFKTSLSIFSDINNVGAISLALFAKGDTHYDKAIASRWQATQVSVISVANSLGRILIGSLVISHES